MKVSKIFLFLFFVTVSLAVFPQSVQKGYVKTKGRMNERGEVMPGVRLKDVSITLRGGNAVKSGNNGTFSIRLSSDNYCLQNVQKQGYQLVDPDMLSHCYNYSSNDLIISMETPSQRWDDKRNAERAIRDQLQRQVDSLRRELDVLRDANRISEEEYLRRQQRLFEMYDENDRMVAQMAEEYAAIDFDQLDGFTRQVRQLIMKGDLCQADSLLRSRGNLNQRIADYNRHKQTNDREAAAIAQRQKQLAASTAAAKKERDLLAEECYLHFEICKLNHQFDSAACWIEKRAMLDSTCSAWQIDAGEFLITFMAEFERAIHYFQIPLRMANTLPYDESMLLKETMYNWLGFAFSEQNDYDKALEYYFEELKLDSVLYGLKSKAIAGTYVSLGVVYEHIDDFEQSELYLLKALEIERLLSGDNNSDVSVVYGNLGVTYNRMGKYNEAIDVLQKAIKINKQIGDDKRLAGNYVNLGSVYRSLKNYSLALENTFKALDIFKKLYGDRHPDIGTCYNNIGELYVLSEEYDKALSYMQMSLESDLSFYGEKHVATATSYNNLGSVYNKMGDFAKATEYTRKSLGILTAILGEHHSKVAISNYNIGVLYKKQGMYQEALEYSQKAYNILLEILPEGHPVLNTISEGVEEIRTLMQSSE